MSQNRLRTVALMGNLDRRWRCSRMRTCDGIVPSRVEYLAMLAGSMVL